jgi:hypothetical protein
MEPRLFGLPSRYFEVDSPEIMWGEIRMSVLDGASGNVSPTNWITVGRQSVNTDRIVCFGWPDEKI